ncbi:hypothetical protein CJO94_05840 [Ralstonia solanacearum]|nr:hypothetical protein CJO94_05840 [Ralstonia solanacearum]
MLTDQIVRRWVKAVEQAQTAQDCLRVRQREDKVRYPNPISLALMVVVGRRSMSAKNIAGVTDKELQRMRDAATQTLNKLTPRPTFQAIYTFPSEFRALVSQRRGVEVRTSEQTIYTPFVAFIAKPAVNSIKVGT